MCIYKYVNVHDVIVMPMRNKTPIYCDEKHRWQEDIIEYWKWSLCFRKYCHCTMERIIILGFGKISRWHYNDVIMGAMASQTTSITIVYSAVFFWCTSKKTSKLRVIGLCEGNLPVIGEFPAQRASNAESVSMTSSWDGTIWWFLLMSCHGNAFHIT